MKQNIVLLSYTQNVETVIATAAKMCYSGSNVTELADKISKDDIGTFIQKLLSLGHLSAFEHASFTFAIEGISRVTTHELVRHRLASYSQQSQRYIKEKTIFDYITPDSIEKNEKFKAKYNKFMQDSYNLYNDFIENGIAKEDARFVLPNAKEAKIIVTMNARELMHYFNLRMCMRAQWEIRKMATSMCEIVKAIAPNVFSNSGASCDTLLYCPEGSFSCGRFPTLENR